MPGVRAIFHRGNIGKIFRSTQGQGFDGICEERRPPFEDDVVRYYGQYVACAVADTFETAKAAADAVRVTYAKEKPSVETELKADDDPDVAIVDSRILHLVRRIGTRARLVRRRSTGRTARRLCPQTSPHTDQLARC
jgi:CO/xanthine dehydrogenase Mo-binding subunit